MEGRSQLTFGPLFKIFSDFTRGVVQPVRVLCWAFWWDPTVRTFLIAAWLVSTFFQFFGPTLQSRLLGGVYGLISLSLLSMILLHSLVRGAYRLHRYASYPRFVDWKVLSECEENLFSADRMAKLNGLGFGLAGFLREIDATNQVKSTVALFVNEKNQDSAELIHMEKNKDLFAFKTRFTDGFFLETSNSKLPPFRRKRGHFEAFNVPQITLAADLYRVHRKFRERFESGRLATIFSSSQELEEFISSSEAVHRVVMEKRDLRVDPGTDRYRYTVIGAFKGSWEHLWPVPPIRRLFARQAARRALKNVEFK